MLRLILLILFLGACQKENRGIPMVPSGVRPDLVKSREIIAKNKELVEMALQFMNDEVYYRADGRTPSQCNFTSYKYKIFKRKNALYLESNLFFKGDVDSFRQVERCLPLAESFFERYGVNLIVRAVEKEKADHEIKLIDGFGRSSSTIWHLKGRGVCGVIIHEMGHLFGLPDEYQEDDTCRTQEFAAKEVNPYSLMAYDSDNLDHLQLMPRHIMAILEQAIKSEITLTPSDDGSFAEFFPHCRLSTPQFNFRKNQILTIQEGNESEYISRVSGNVWRQKLYFHIPNSAGEFSILRKWTCPGLGPTQSFVDWRNMFEEVNINASLRPFSFEYYDKYPPLYYIGIQN
jgi:hypothetical protein